MWPFWQPLSPRSEHYNELNTGRILGTLDRLIARIDERFPQANLLQVGRELRQVAHDVALLCHWLRRPLWSVRILAILVGIGMIGIAGWAIQLSLRVELQVNGISDLLQGIESAINELIFLAIALFFLATTEVRIKRQAALKALHQLRSIAHVVDMHQLTKDPAYLFGLHQPTASSPERILSAYELARYLDYCSELLSITSKLAALHAQYLNDPVVLNAVNDVETLAHSLSNKVWQKIMILDMARPGDSVQGDFTVAPIVPNPA
ncbi:MAG: hypothetical protein H6555_04445 [Lewinellaceae bacterium]|nr:hypothetical protein [Lewinellaceae bacterium]